MSETRKRYMIRLVLRWMVFLLCCVGAVFAPEQFAVLEGMNFFREFSWLHLLWLVWVMDMLPQILPYPNRVPLGSMKLFARRFRPARDPINREALRSHIIASTKAAYRVFLLYAALVLAFIAWLVWELSVMMHPERFWDRTNAALKCASCTDKLCTQFCPKRKN